MSADQQKTDLIELIEGGVGDAAVANLNAGPEQVITDIPDAPRDTDHWAQAAQRIHAPRSDAPRGVVPGNINNRRPVGPLQGFGRMWQKTYQLRLSGAHVTPAEVIQVWKEHLPEFQPPQFHFFPTAGGVAPNQALFINASIGGLPVDTGMLVMYSDDESFTLMTPQGHPESGWVTFSAYMDGDCAVCQVQSIARANDPLYELGFRMGGSRSQEKVWPHVLERLAAYYGLSAPVRTSVTCVDPHVQWSQAGNIWLNAIVRSMLGAPFRVFRRRR
jgi:hypothetical protein